MQVVHLSLFHSPLDTRIFRKECVTLAQAGYEVHLVASGPQREPCEGVTFHSIGTIPDDIGLTGRLWFHLRGSWRALRIARRLRAPLYHLHEVPLIPVGIWLRMCGARVVYDVHEDAFREKISNGRTLGHPWAGWIYAVVAAVLETLAKCCFHGFVAATPHIGKKFPDCRTTVVQNFPSAMEPVHDQSLAESATCSRRENSVVYIGNLFANRGAREMVDAVALLPDHLDPRLVIVGQLVPASLQAQLEERPGWRRVEFAGWQDQSAVEQIMGRTRIGLLLFHPRPEHLDSYPNKLFEYMAAGLPVIASDFPLWRGIITDAGCGLLVDPQKPHEIAAAIEDLLRHPDKAADMGQRGRVAVRDKYNWQRESKKLLDFYRRFDASDVAHRHP